MYVITADGEPIAVEPAWDLALKAATRALPELYDGCAVRIKWICGDETLLLNAGKVWEKRTDSGTYKHVTWDKNTIKDFTPKLSAEERLIYDRFARCAERRLGCT